MMNETVLALMEKNFSVYMYPSKGGGIYVVIVKRDSNETSGGHGDTPEKALSNAMLDWIHRNGRI